MKTFIQNPDTKQVFIVNVNEADQREADIQTVCNYILKMSPTSTGDSGSGAECPFCFVDCKWDLDVVTDIENHKHDCIVLIAKDLTTNIK